MTQAALAQKIARHVALMDSAEMGRLVGAIRMDLNVFGSLDLSQQIMFVLIQQRLWQLEHDEP